MYRNAATALEKLAPAAAKATAAFAEVVGGLPASVPGTLPTAASQILMHWAPGSASFFAGDIVGIVAKSLRAFADEISAGTRSAELGATIDEVGDVHGRKKLAAGGLHRAFG